MNSKIEKPTFKNLMLDELDLAKEQNNTQLEAILMAALYQNDCLHKIINTKMTAVCPSIASEAFTTANDIAEKIYEKRKQIAAQDNAAAAN